MSAASSTERRGLAYVDPARHTPHYSWRPKSGANEVFCENVPLTQVAERFGTPAYVYSKHAILDAYDAFHRGLARVSNLLCFAVKANGNLSILKMLAGRGSGFDIVSGGELEFLRRIGVGGDRIVFSGVGKTREEICEALRYRHGRLGQRGILQFNVESAEELEVLAEEASRLSGRPPRVSIRVNPDVRAGGHPHIATGLQQHKFGIAWPEARKLYLAHKGSKYIRWQGISAHIGSQIVDLAPFRTAMERVAGYLLDLRAQGIGLKYLDVGGGLGVRYTEERPPSRQAYARLLTQIVQPLGVGLLLEPGRSIIAESAVVLTRVSYTKKNKKTSFVVVDAAMNDLMRPILYGAPHPITRMVRGTGNDKSGGSERVDVVGPVCESGDTFLRDWPLGSATPGDLLAIWGAGAYGMVQSSNYNGRVRAPEILVDGKSAKLIRRRETLNDLLATDVLA
jgi:diaminopimelate decarboxylase